MFKFYNQAPAILACTWLDSHPLDEPQIVKETSVGGWMDRNRRFLISPVRFHKHLIP